MIRSTSIGLAITKASFLFVACAASASDSSSTLHAAFVPVRSLRVGNRFSLLVPVPVPVPVQRTNERGVSTPPAAINTMTRRADRCMVSNVEGSAASGDSSKVNKKPKTKRNRQPRDRKENLGSGSQPQTWRLYGITTHPDKDDWNSLQKDQRAKDLDLDERTAPIPSALQTELYKRLKFDMDEQKGPASIKVIRRSLDARRKLDHPVFNYVVDVILSPEQARTAHLQHRPGRTERLEAPTAQVIKPENIVEKSNTPKKRVLVVGAGPAGLFCAL